jgi:hypothetical protein
VNLLPPQAVPTLQLPQAPQLQQQQQQQQQQQPAAVFEWPGLHTWRSKGIDPRRSWGDRNAATADVPEPAAAAAEALPMPSSLVGVALQVLNTANPNHKAAITHRGWKAYCAGIIPLHEPEQHQQQEASSSSSSSSSASAVSSLLETQSNSQQQPQLATGSSNSSSSTAGTRSVTSASASTNTQQQQQQQQQPPDRPARPDKPQLVIPKLVPSPKASPLPLNAHMLHNLVRTLVRFELAVVHRLGRRGEGVPLLVGWSMCFNFVVIIVGRSSSSSSSSGGLSR